MNEDYFKKFTKFAFYPLIISVFVVFTLRLYYLQIIKGKHFRDASLSNRVRVIKVPAPRGIIYDRNGLALVKNKPYFSASIMSGQMDLDIKKLSKLLRIDKIFIKERIEKGKSRYFESTILKEGLSFKEVAKIEARRSDFPGLMIDTNIIRHYVYDKIGAHFIGYIGKPTSKQLKDLEQRYITPETFLGKWGVESLLEERLRGIPGKEIIEVDALGRQLRVLDYQLPEKGKDLKLSLDIKLQKVAVESFGNRAGALLALDPRSGEVIASVSLPTFNPNDFIHGIDTKKWESLNKDIRHPFLNRVLQSVYPPGSVFKIVVAIAGLEEGIITPDFKVYCNGLMHFGNRSYGCWKRSGHGFVSFQKAMIESCDIYFYEVGRRLGINKIEKYARLFGLGRETGLGISGEQKGIIPDPEWKINRIGRKWYEGETLNTAIGQGYIAVTPAQIAIMTSMVANNGTPLSLTVLKNSNVQPSPKKIKINDSTFATVKRALRGVVNSKKGTGTAAKIELVDISGKTGTAQVIKGRIKTEKLEDRFKEHAWFVAYAPSDSPEIVVAVLVEHGGHGGSAAAPIAKNVIEAYIKGKTELKIK